MDLKERCKQAVKNSFTMKEDCNNLLKSIADQVIDDSFDRLYELDVDLVNRATTTNFENYEEKLENQCVESFRNIVETICAMKYETPESSGSLEDQCKVAVKESFSVNGDENGVLKDIMDKTIDSTFHMLFGMTKRIVEKKYDSTHPAYKKMMINGCIKAFEEIILKN